MFRIEIEIVFYLFLSVIIMLFAETAETARRAAYDSLQNMSDRDSRSKPGTNCPEKQSYDDNQRDLKKQ